MDESLNKFNDLVVPYEDMRLVLYRSNWSFKDETRDEWVPGIDVEAYPALWEQTRKDIVKMLDAPTDKAASVIAQQKIERHRIEEFFSNILKVKVMKLALCTVHPKIPERPEHIDDLSKFACEQIKRIGEEHRDEMKVKYFCFYTDPAYATAEEAKKVAINIADICQAIRSGNLTGPV